MKIPPPVVDLEAGSPPELRRRSERQVVHEIIASAITASSVTENTAAAPMEIPAPSIRRRRRRGQDLQGLVASTIWSMMHKKQRTIAPSQKMITDLSEASIWDWDVFLSFRGVDTRYKFTDHLYHYLKRKHIRVFRDAEGLRTGDEISPSLVKAIEGSRVSVVIFSGDYASSNSCLDELVTILQCKEERKQRVIPIFYEVNPSKVRYHEMAVLEQKYGKDRVQNWRSALEIATRLKGESFLGGYEYEFIEKIVKKIMSFLGPPRLYVAENPVGLDSRISEFILLTGFVCSGRNDVLIFGIFGISGIGKTTFAKAIYNMVAVQFESVCFVEVGVKASTEDGLVRVQETILATVLAEVDLKLRNIHEGVTEMQQRLRNKKILLILDDVDELEQLKKLAGCCNWFGPGSRVIITTQHQDLLRQHMVDDERTYELKPLDHHEALELFCWHACKRREPVADYADISNDLTDYAQGHPLALEIIGADLCGKEKDEWESTLADHKSIISDDIFTRLKVSYNKLRYNTRQMFRDIACFFNGESWDYLEKIFDGCCFNPIVGMRVLKEKCFIRRQDGKVWMHNLVRDMGREIVRQESEAEPGKRSRLWHYEDVLRVLTTRDLGTSAIQGLMLDLPERSTVDWNNDCLAKMINLRILIMRNARFSTPPEQLPNSVIVLNWEEYPSSSFPPDFMGKKLLDLRLGNAILPIQLGYPLKEFENLKYLSVTGSEQVKKVPNLSWAVNLIEKRLDFCCNLVEFDNDNGMISLPRLEVFSAMGCSNLRKCPEISSPVLKTYNLSGCRRLKSVPPVRSEALQEISVQGCGQNIARCFYENEVNNNYPVIFVPGDTLPWFFQYVNYGGSLSFWVRRRVPTICVGFALHPMSFSKELYYEIRLFLGDNLLVVRKGKFNQNSCRVFFCYLTNGLTEENRILQDDWVKAEVNAIVKFSDVIERHPLNCLIREAGTFMNSRDSHLEDVEFDIRLRRQRDKERVPISETGAFVNSTDSHFEDVKFDTRFRRQGDWAMTHVDALSAVNILTSTDEGTSMFGFKYVDGDSDDDFVDGPLTVRKKAQARVDLPIMGWVKLRTSGYGEDPGFLAVRDWTGSWLVGSSSWVSRMEYGFTNIKKALGTCQEAKNIKKAMLQSMEHAIELVSQRTIIYELKELWWMINVGREKSLVRDYIDKLVVKIGSVIMKYFLQHAKKELVKMEHWRRCVGVMSVAEWRSPSKMKNELRDVLEKFQLEIESIIQVEIEHEQRDAIRKWKPELRYWIRRGHWPSYLLDNPASETQLVSLTEFVRGHTDVLEKSMLEIVLIMQMEMKHVLGDVIEKLVLRLMAPINMEHVLGDGKINSVRQIEPLNWYIMELALWNVKQNMVLDIKPRSQMAIEHRHRDTIEYVKPEIEPTSQMEMEHRLRDTIEYVKPEIELFKQMMTQVRHGELSDIQRGLEWALGRGLLKVIVESDSQDTIRCLVDGVGSDHPCSALVKECRQLFRKAEEVCLRHVPPKPNQVVKYFTQLPHRRGELGKILRDFCGVV